MLYVITGPAGVGKTTTSNALCKRLEKSVLLEGDEIYHHVINPYVEAWKEGNHLEVFQKASEKLIEVYQEEGYDVVYNYIVTESMLKRFKEKFGIFKLICFLANEEELLKRDAERPTDCQMRERCIVLLESFKNKDFIKKYTLDTSGMTVDEVVDELLKNEKYLYK